MNLLLRFVAVLVALLAHRRRLSVVGESVLTFRAWPHDIDLNGHVNNSRYSSFMDLGRIDLIGRTGLARSALKRGWQPVLGSINLRYRRPMTLFQRCRVRTRFLGWDDKWFYLEQRVERDGELLVSGLGRGLFRGPGGNVPPAEVLRAASAEVVAPELPAAVLTEASALSVLPMPTALEQDVPVGAREWASPAARPGPFQRPRPRSGNGHPLVEAPAVGTTPAARPATRPVASSRFVWAVLAGGGLVQLGGYVDAWAHVHFVEQESFFTPWHGVLYFGFLFSTVVLVGQMTRNHRRGFPWAGALPRGYGVSLLGAALFGTGGTTDYLWHMFFGLEVDTEALLSPPHLLLAIGSTLIMCGPLCAAWKQEPSLRDPGLRANLPMVLSMAFVLSALAFWTNYAHPIARPWPALGNQPTPGFFPVVADPVIRGGGISNLHVAHALGVASVLLQSGILAGVVLAVLRRWDGRLPPGSLTIAFGYNALLIGFLQPGLIPALVLAGVIADVLRLGLRPSAARPSAARVFGFAVPAVYYALYFLALELSKGVWWSAHLTAGATVLAGLVGLLVSVLVMPPPSVDAAARPHAPLPVDGH